MSKLTIKQEKVKEATVAVTCPQCGDKKDIILHGRAQGCYYYCLCGDLLHWDAMTPPPSFYNVPRGNNETYY